MEEPRAQRTLVKSPPELWAEISDLEALARHLGEFGEIRITRLEPETTVAWEGDRASGTVQLEPSGWGTKVTLTAELAGAVAPPEPVSAPEPVPVPVRIAPQPVPDPEPEEEPEPEPLPAAAAGEPAPARKPGFFARLFGRRAVAEPAPEPVEAQPEDDEPAEPEAVEPEIVQPGVAEPAPAPAPAPVEPAREAGAAGLDPGRALAILTGVLDDLGSARHRPFSR
jgi:hypothetical protein